jgi:hypothetical protein
MADLEIRSPATAATPSSGSHVTNKTYVDGAIATAVANSHVATVVSLSNVGTGGTVTLAPGQGKIYRCTCTGTTATLANPANPTNDGEVMNVEILSTGSTTTLTINASILMTGGLAASVVIPVNKRWFGALRYVTGVGWFMLASSLQN